MTSPEEIIDQIRDAMKEIPNHKIYFTLRSMRLKYVRKETVELVKACVILDEIGLPITISLISSILNIPESAATTRLHNLGDKHVLILHRQGSRTFKWSLSNLFKKHYSGEL